MGYSALIFNLNLNLSGGYLVNFKEVFSIFRYY